MAQDELTNDQIAARIGVTRQTLQVWKKRPEFGARVRELLKAMAEAVKGRGIAERENRVAALNQRWEKLHEVMAARSKEIREVPSGDTGLLIRDLKLVKAYMVVDGDGESGERRDEEELVPGRRMVQVAEYPIDLGLLKELRDLERQAAMEMGQWEEKSRVEETVLVREYVGVDVEAV